MPLNEIRAKKNCKLKPSHPLPVTETQIKGYFNGFSVTVEDKDDMKKIVSMGYFGKANLSRSGPQFHNEIIFKRVFNNRKRYTKDTPRKIIVLPDSETESDYFTNLKPEFQLDTSGIQETVNLGLEEAFFLVNAINCLQVFNEEKKLSPEELWNIFKSTDKYFVENYIAYYYFRSKNWVVKPGIKFGGDFCTYF